MIRRAPALAVLLLLPGSAAGQAIDLDLQGYGDVRLVGTTGQRSAFQGGLGKLGWDGSSSQDFRTEPEFAELLAAGSIGLTPELRGIAELRFDPNQRTELDLLDAFFRWRPVSTTNWRWSVKSGAFFPPISLENQEIGWTSAWTLTPSAINSWVGDELRTLGGEATLEWRDGVDDVQLSTALFGWNDPAGAALAHRGWIFDDQPTGLFSDLRVPDPTAQRSHLATPAYAEAFHEIDNAPGWYGNLSWQREGLGHVQLLRYDNEADPTAENADQYAWRTDFWSLGASTRFGPVTLEAQAMTGSTSVSPDGLPSSTTGFHAAYLLLGWQDGDWRIAARLDQFGTRERHLGPAPELSEHGWSPVTAVTWEPRDWLRLTGEALIVDSWRTERLVEGLAPRAIEAQLQFGVRVFF